MLSPDSYNYDKCLQGLGTNSYEYESVELDVKKIKSSNGDRLVGARSATTKKYPFLVGWRADGFEFEDTFECTGSLITRSYVLSAAHCNNLIRQHENREERREDCVRTTARGEYYTEGVKGKFEGVKLQCKWLQDKDLEIRTDPKGKAWIGVDDKNIDQELNAEKMVEIKGCNHKF